MVESERGGREREGGVGECVGEGIEDGGIIHYRCSTVIEGGSKMIGGTSK